MTLTSLQKQRDRCTEPGQYSQLPVCSLQTPFLGSDMAHHLLTYRKKKKASEREAILPLPGVAPGGVMCLDIE